MLVNYHPGPECSIHWAARTVTRGEDVLMRKREKNNGWRVKDVKVSNYRYYRGRYGLYVHMICAMYRYSYPWWRFNQGDFVCLHPIPGTSIRKKHLVVFNFLVLFESEGKTRKDQRHARDSESAVNTTASTPRFSRLVEDCPTIYVTCTCSLNTWLKTKWKYAVDMTMSLRSKLTAHMGSCDGPGICEA